MNYYGTKNLQKKIIRVSNTGLTISYGKGSIKVRNKIKGKRKRNKRVKGEGGGWWGAIPPPFRGGKLFFHVKSENIKFLHVKNI